MKTTGCSLRLASLLAAFHAFHVFVHAQAPPVHSPTIFFPAGREQFYLNDKISVSYYTTQSELVTILFCLKESKAQEFDRQTGRGAGKNSVILSFDRVVHPVSFCWLYNADGVDSWSFQVLDAKRDVTTTISAPPSTSSPTSTLSSTTQEPQGPTTPSASTSGSGPASTSGPSSGETPPATTQGGISTGAITGISIAVGVVAAGFGAVASIVWNRRRRLGQGLEQPKVELDDQQRMITKDPAKPSASTPSQSQHHSQAYSWEMSPDRPPAELANARSP